MNKNLVGKKQVIALLCVVIMAFSSLIPIMAHAGRITISAPKSLHIVSVKDTSVTIAWSAPDKGKIKSYNIYKDNVVISNTISTTYTAAGLVAGSTYKFYVKAIDIYGNLSAASNIISVTVTGAPIATPAPTATPVATATPAPTATPVATATPAPTPITNGSKLVGYYAAWSAYSGFSPDRLDASKLTHINYAFANIGSDLKIALGYPDVDPGNIQKLNALKQMNPKLKTIISVGGWSWSGRFSDVALTDASRTVFADSCVDFIVQYNFDGVDIDWEYPVSGGLFTNITRPEDKQNYTLLMQKLREKLDARGALDGKQYILTYAGAGTYGFINNTESTNLLKYVDYVNIMTYDIHGTWDRYTDFNSPLYKNSDISPQYKWSVDDCINMWINAGFPAEKIVMGIPFYGYVYNAVGNTNNGLYQTYSGGSSISYANIEGNYLNKPEFIRYFHPESMVPWLFNGSTFVSYEDEQSISLKAEYIKTKGLGGAMVWELSQDPNQVLFRALYNSLNN